MNLVDKIKLLFVARKPIQEIVSDVKNFKSGYKTLSFWVALLGSLSALGLAIQGFVPGTTAVLIITGLTCAYNLARGFEKADVNGVRPTLQSTEFWLGVLGILSDNLIHLKTAGVSAPWVTSASTIIAAIMAQSQNLGAMPPDTQTPSKI